MQPLNQLPRKWVLVNRHPPAHIAERYLYAAFGSNLMLAQIAERCPDAEIVGPGIVQGAQLIFSRVASIVESEKGSVLVGLYKLSASDIDRLDRREGMGRVYDRVLVTADTATGPVRCFTYVKRTRYPERPSKAYYAKIAQGFVDWQFSDKRLRVARARAAKRVHPKPFGTYHPPATYTYKDDRFDYGRYEPANYNVPKSISTLGSQISEDLNRIRRSVKPAQTVFTNAAGQTWHWVADVGWVRQKPKDLDRDFPEEWLT